jgi:DNA segregation ATPase FtsK/SpoIIIE, S-DNA-T family
MMIFVCLLALGLAWLVSGLILEARNSLAEQSSIKHKISRLQEEQKRLQGRIPSEKEQLRQGQNSQEKSKKDSLNRAKQRVSDRLYSIKVDSEAARLLAKEECPRRLKQEWLDQEEAVSGLMSQADGTTIKELSSRLLSRPWSDPCWFPSTNHPECYRPQTSGLAPGILRVGSLLLERELEQASVPALVPIRQLSSDPNYRLPGHVVIFSNDSESRQAAIAAIESIALRVISTFPVRKMQGVFIDPVSMGNSFPFKSLPRFIVGQQTYTRSEDVREQLNKLTVHTEQVIQNYLSRYYETIEDYNAVKAAIEEAYKYLFVADFPTNFDNQACEDLKSLLVNGAKAGVYSVIHIDDTLEKPRNFSYDIFNDYCTVLHPAHGLTTGGSFNKRGSLKAGYVYVGKVTRITHMGAYVEVLPGKEGFVQTSQLAEYRVAKPEDAVSVGQVMSVKILDIDSKDRISLSCIGIQQKEASAAASRAFEGNDFKDAGRPLFSMQLPNGLEFNIQLDQPPSNDLFNQLTAVITEASKTIKVDTVSFSDLYPPQFWQDDSRREIRAPIGVTGARDRVEFWMGNDEEGLVVSSGLLAGKPGAGKSFTLHAIISSLAMKYAPDELEMYLLDFKEGVEFQIYVDPEKSESANLSDEPDEAKALPHAKVISIESDREFGLSVLQRVQQEIEERGSQFKSAGVSSLTDYRDRTQEKMPRVLVVIDEFQYMFQENDAITGQLNLIFEDITRRGRAFGVHLLIASQSPNVPNMNRRIYSFIELRMAMQMDQSTAGFVLAEGNTDAVDLLERPGKVIYNKDFGRKGHNDIGQIADVGLAQRQNALREVQAVATERAYERPEPLVIFYGNRPTKLEHNGQLLQLSNMERWLSLSELNKQVLAESDWLTQEFPGVAWLGEAMRIGSHTKAIFRRRPRSNMLLVGTSEETIFGILGGIFLSLVHCYQPQNAEFQIIDLSIPNEEDGNDWSKMTTTFRDQFSEHFLTGLGKRFPDTEQKIVRAEMTLKKVYEEFERRQQMREENPDEMNFGASLFFVCAIGGLNRAQNLRPVVGKRGDEMSSDAQNLLMLVSKGSELGIHTILWMDSTKSFLQMFGDSRAAFTHFDLRVGLTMPPDDSRQLLGESYAQNLPRLRAYFHDVAIAAGLEKFKPYAIPSSQEIQGYSQRLDQRSY